MNKTVFMSDFWWLPFWRCSSMPPTEVNAGKKETYHSVAVIVDDSSSDRWTAFKEGLEQGADEENFHINVVSTSSFVNLHEECSIISRELENGADGVIVQLCGDDAGRSFFRDCLRGSHGTC